MAILKALAAGQEAEGRAVERAGGKYFRAQVSQLSQLSRCLLFHNNCRHLNTLSWCYCNAGRLGEFSGKCETGGGGGAS